MSVQLVPVTQDVPKESKEVVDFTCDVVAHLLKGGKISELVNLLPEGMVAADGSLKVSEEVGSDNNDELAGYVVQKVLSTLKTKKPIAPQA